MILERVGNGAMGVVYGAYDPELDRKIALKLLRTVGAGAGAAPLAKARMMREAKAMARLSHPNVAAVHDVGEYEERVFLATEFLSGGTLRSWLDAAPRTWREIVGVFTAAGRGLAAAHAAGLVHRDFKPDNVLLDKEGRARVVDFGLARNAEAIDEESEYGGRVVDLETRDGGSEKSNALPPPKYDPNLETGVDPNPSDKLDKLTRTGALMGTPAYMAPEQFLAEGTDERTDQFSFCVALYEALYGQRPFEGETLLALSTSVTGGLFRPLPKERDVPAWIRRAVMHGLRLRRDDRYPSMAALIAALEADPAIRRRRHLVAGAAIALVAASVIVAQQAVQRRRQEIDRQVASRVAEAKDLTGRARAGLVEARAKRQAAFAAFDKPDRDAGEALWREALRVPARLDADFERAEQALEAALVLDPGQETASAELGAVLSEHLRAARELRQVERVSALAGRLAKLDPDGSRGLGREVPAVLRLVGTPAGAQLTLERYERDATTGVRAARVQPFPVAGEDKLAPGSYRISLRAPGRAELRVPFEAVAGQTTTVDLAAPTAASVPEGFVYVPAGAFWFGDGDERLRTEFLDTVPAHRRETGAYLIGRHEVTYAEWIGFLETLPKREQAAYAPNVSSITRGALQLQPREHGWQLSFQPTSQRYTAAMGTPVAYLGRTLRARQDWLQFPVTGVSSLEAARYAGWLDSSGRVPGARLCTEVEWERAARGADERPFPHGDLLAPDDANFDTTYGRVDTAYGPDVVGSHPASRSPFEIDDLAGNVLELTISALKSDEIVMRGGAYFFNSATCRATNRNAVPRTFRDVTTGIRICASIGDDTHGGKNEAQ